MELKEKGAVDSMHEEMKEIGQAVSPSEIFEYDYIKRTRPKARFVRGMLLTYIKHKKITVPSKLLLCKSALFCVTSFVCWTSGATHPVVGAWVGLIGVRAGRKIFKKST